MTGVLSAQFEKRFRGGAVIQGALTQSTGRFSVTVLFGPSGCGKTTVLRCLAGLERPDAGRITCAGEIWFDSVRREFLPPQRRGIGYLFQDYALFPHLNVFQNIAFGLSDEATAECRRRVLELLDILRLTGLERRTPNELSGGQQQRVALARTVARRPALLLLDEPLSALDAATREELRRELRRILADFAIPVVVVTHDRLEALALADEMVVMDQGVVIQSGPTPEVFTHPKELAIARIIGMETVEPGKVLAVADGLATVQVGTVQLSALASPDLGTDVFVCIRGEDVVLEKGPASRLSARNSLPGRVRSILQEGPLVRLRLDCGFPLTALVTRRSAEDFELEEGALVTAIVKAPSIHLVPRRPRD